MLFCATLGAGTQLLLMTVGILVIGLLGAFPAHARGTIHLAALMLYALSAAPSSYVSSLWYKKMDGEKWWWNILLTSLMICGPFVLVLSFLNTVSIVYGTTAAVSFYGLLHMLSFSLGVALPLYMIGGIQGKNAAQPFDFPCRSLPHVREIPPLPWYRDLPVQLLFAGFLPFTGIYIELHYIYFSVWSHAVYTYYGMLSLAFTMLLAVTSLVTITFAYMQLAAEDHRWWWKSLFTGGAAGLFMLGYSCYFYFSLPMNGFLQTAFYAGYMLLAAYFTSLMLAAVGFFATFYFVLFLYNRVKDD